MTMIRELLESKSWPSRLLIQQLCEHLMPPVHTQINVYLFYFSHVEAVVLPAVDL